MGFAVCTCMQNQPKQRSETTLHYYRIYTSLYYVLICINHVDICQDLKQPPKADKVEVLCAATWHWANTPKELVQSMSTIASMSGLSALPQNVVQGPRILSRAKTLKVRQNCQTDQNSMIWCVWCLLFCDGSEPIIVFHYNNCNQSHVPFRRDGQNCNFLQLQAAILLYMYVICGHQEMKLHCQTVQQRKARYYNDCFPIGLLCQSGHLFVSVATCFDGRRPVRNKQVQGIQRTLRGYNRVRLLQTYSGASHSPSSTKNSSWTLGRSNPRQACKGYAKVAERRFSTNLPVFPEPPRMKTGELSSALMMTSPGHTASHYVSYILWECRYHFRRQCGKFND